MELRISKQAQAVIQEKRPSNARMLVDFEDAIGPFADDSVSCQLYPAFRLLFVPQTYPEEALSDYNKIIETEIGPIYMKEQSIMLLDQSVELVLEPNYQRLQLRSKAGVLVANLPIKQILS